MKQEFVLGKWQSYIVNIWIKYLKYLEFKIIISKQNIPSQLIQLNSFLYMGIIYKSSYYSSEKKENSKTGNLLMISLSLRNLKQLKRRNI
jgi:hypothetical protein